MFQESGCDTGTKYMKSLISRHADCLQEWFLYVDDIIIELKGLDGRLFMGAYPATKKILGKQKEV